MQKSNLHRVIYGLIIALCVAVDQWTKQLAVLYLKPIGSVTLLKIPYIGDVLHLTYSTNDGAAFGMLDDHPWVFMVFSTVAILALGVYLFRGVAYLADKRADGTYPPIDLFGGLAFSLIIGGGIGNMIDRIALQYVVDFIGFSLPRIGFHFAIFNGADSCVTVGAVLLIVHLIMILVRKKDKTEKTNSKEQ